MTYDQYKRELAVKRLESFRVVDNRDTVRWPEIWRTRKEQANGQG